MLITIIYLVRLSISIASYCVFLLLNEGTRGRELVRES